MRILILFLVFFSAMVLATNIYEWKDAQGNVYFSDTPKKGAKKLNIQEAQTFTPSVEPKEKKTKTEQPTQTSFYTVLSISTPRNNTTVQNRSGEVNVSIEINPSLRPKDKIQLIMDGNPVGDPQPSTIFRMNNVDRGIHTLSAAVINDNGGTIISSDKITFYVLRPTKLEGPLHNNSLVPKKHDKIPTN